MLASALLTRPAHSRLRRRREPVAQAVEHETFNLGAVGSSPTGLTKEIKGLATASRFTFRKCVSATGRLCPFWLTGGAAGVTEDDGGLAAGRRVCAPCPRIMSAIQAVPGGVRGGFRPGLRRTAEGKPVAVGPVRTRARTRQGPPLARRPHHAGAADQRRRAALIARSIWREVSFPRTSRLGRDSLDRRAVAPHKPSRFRAKPQGIAGQIGVGRQQIV